MSNGVKAKIILRIVMSITPRDVMLLLLCCIYRRLSVYFFYYYIPFASYFPGRYICHRRRSPVRRDQRRLVQDNWYGARVFMTIYQ